MMTPDDLSKLAYHVPELRESLRDMVGRAVSKAASSVMVGPLEIEVHSVRYTLEDHTLPYEDVCWALFAYGGHTFAEHLDHLGHYDVSTVVRQALLPLAYGVERQQGLNLFKVFRALEKLEKASIQFDRAFSEKSHDILDAAAAECLLALSNLLQWLQHEKEASRLEAARQMLMIHW